MSSPSSSRPVDAIDPAHPLRFLGRYVRLGLRRFGPLFGLVIGAGVCAVAVQYEMKVLVDAMALPGRQLTPVVQAFVMFIAIIAVETTLWRVAGWLGAHAIVEAGVKIRLDLFERLSAKPLSFFSDAFSGALGSRITAVSGAFGALMNTLIWSVLPPCIDFVGALVLFSLLDIGMAVAVAALVIGIAGGLLIFGVRGRDLHQAYAAHAGKASGELIDTIANFRTVKMFGMHGREHSRLDAVFGTEADAQRRSWTHLEKSRMLHDALLWVAAAGILAWAVMRWSAGSFSPGDVVLVSALTFRILHGSRDLALALIGSANQIAVVRETLLTLSGPPAPREGAKTLVSRTAPTIEVTGLSHYYRADAPVLTGIDLHIPAGQRLGIIGESGAGKSTLLALLRRLHEPDSGEVRIGSLPIGDLSEDCLRELIAFVPQEVGLFHRSILENLRYGRPEASDEEIREAAAIAQCDFIDALPDGFDTIVGEGGMALSGGQRQRVAIARALLKRAPVLLLDEATSALDTETERRLRIALGRLDGFTVISATHRLATLEGYDRVIVLEQGRIVRDGTPASVLSHGAPAAFARAPLRSISERFEPQDRAG